MTVVVGDFTDVSKHDDMAIAVGKNDNPVRPISLVIMEVHRGRPGEPVVAVSMTRERAKAVLKDLLEVLDETEVRQ